MSKFVYCLHIGPMNVCNQHRFAAFSICRGSIACFVAVGESPRGGFIGLENP